MSAQTSETSGMQMLGGKERMGSICAEGAVACERLCERDA